MFTVYITSFEYNFDQNIITNISVFILLIEVLLKVLAFGLLNVKYGFFHNSWNVFDFILLLMTLLFSSIRKESNDYIINFTFYRIFHILKLLKVKEYVYLMAGIFSSFKSMINFLLIISIFVFFFTISSTFLFSGILENKCISPYSGLANLNIFCKNNNDCPIDMICGRIPFSNPDNGTTNFDSFFYSMIQIFRIITFASFTSIIILMEQTFSNYIWFYFIFIGIFGNFFFINLIFAALKVKYSEYKEKFLKNQLIPEFSVNVKRKTYDFRETQKKGILLKQKLKKTRRFLQRFFRNKATSSIFLEKGKHLMNHVLMNTYTSPTPYSGQTPSDYRNIKKTSNTPLSSCLKKAYGHYPSMVMNPPVKVGDMAEFIKKSRLSILKNRAMDTPGTGSPLLSSSPNRKSLFSNGGTINKKILSEINRTNRMNNFHQIFVNRIVKRESKMIKNKEDTSSSQFGSSKSNALDDGKMKDNPIFFILLKLVKIIKNKFLKLEKKFENYYEKSLRRKLNIQFLSKRIKIELIYESDSADDVLPLQ